MTHGARGVRAVLFDLDGVLVDSFEAWFHVVNAAARGFAAPEVSKERFATVWGQGISADVKHLYPGRTHAEVEAAYEREMAGATSTIRTNPEGGRCLDELARRGISRALVTNTQIGIARAVLGAARLADRFETIAGMKEGVREKPAPDLLLAAMQALDVQAHEALMVGDSRYDEEAAAAAHVPFLRYDLRTGASLAQAVSHAVSQSSSQRLG